MTETNSGEYEMISSTRSLAVAIVGIDGCGKSSTFKDVLTELAPDLDVAGVGEEVLAGKPGSPLAVRTDIPLTRSSQLLGRAAHRLGNPGFYKQLKLVELSERNHMAEVLSSRDRPVAVVTDGDPLTNVTAWSVAKFYRRWLASDDELFDVVAYMSGQRRIPLARIPWYTRHAWQLVLLNRLHLTKFRIPDMVFLLQISPANSMERIRARGKPLQKHENEAFLTDLAAAYERVCRVLESRYGAEVVRLNVDELSHADVVAQVASVIRARARRSHVEPVTITEPGIDVIATTMSGSIKDQRKVGLIGPEFERHTPLPVRVHLADSHAEARELAHEIVGSGGRTLVSAGGAGTFNAVLEGCHLEDGVPSDLELAFLRKGSADLIGKALNIPDSLPEAVTAIMAGLHERNFVQADVLRIEAAGPDDVVQTRPVVGFGGFGIFGEIPRFTETRIIKFYKGILGQLFGDLGPFYAGLVMAMISWRIQRAAGRIAPLILTLDGEKLPARVWGTVTIVNGDLGEDFPLGRGLSFSSGSFRVIALRYVGLRKAIQQINACRTGKVLDDPDHYSALVRDVRSLVVRPARHSAPFMVNVDGLRMIARDEVHISLGGTVQLVSAPSAGISTGEPGMA